MDCVVGRIACWQDCGSWVVGIATRIAGSGIACVSAGLSVVQDCVVGGIVWLAGLPTRIARRGIAGLRGCRQWVESGLPTGGIAWQVGLPHAGLPVMGLLLAGLRV